MINKTMISNIVSITSFTYRVINLIINCIILFMYHANPPGIKRRSNVSFRSHVARDVTNHAETSSRGRNWYVIETDLLETSLRRLIGM